MTYHSDFQRDYLNETATICNNLLFQIDKFNQLIDILEAVRTNKGRVFVIGLGGSAANASHFVNDLRKLCGICAFAPTDNVAELTARVNDEGFQTIFDGWLKLFNPTENDCLFVLSVGGGSLYPPVSVPIVNAINYMKMPLVNSKVIGICANIESSHLTVKGDCVIVIPLTNKSRITPHTEEMQSVVCHLLVSHPRLKLNKTVW
jgi:D-sedoheptulose 7-phosphate isomerase